MKDKTIFVKVIFGIFAVIGVVLIIVGILWAVFGSRFMIDHGNPENDMLKFGLYLGSSIFIGMGVIFASVGVFPLIGMSRRSSAKKKLIASGQYIYATVESIQYNENHTVNGQHPFVVYCTYRDDYRDIVYRFKSEDIWTNPEYVIRPGSEIKVFADRQNYKNYHVDIEGILQGKIVDYT